MKIYTHIHTYTHTHIYIYIYQDITIDPGNHIVEDNDISYMMSLIYMFKDVATSGLQVYIAKILRSPTFG